MILPTITLGGTKKQVLVEELRDALEALRLAEIAHSKTCPHPRDYPAGRTYSQFQSALAEHTLRREKLGQVLTELSFLIEGIYELPGE